MRKHKRRDGIVIDLTSMLDIIFIVLLVLVCYIKLSGNSVAEEREALKEQRKDLSRQQSIYEQQIEAINSKGEYVVFISVDSSFSEENPRKRNIFVLNSDKSNGKPPEIPELDGQDINEGYMELNSYLSDYIGKNKDKIIVLTYNEGDKDILYTDEKEIDKIFTELQSAYPDNVRRK